MLFLDTEALRELALPADLLPTIRRAFEECEAPPERNHYALPGPERGTLLVMPACTKSHGVGVKLLTIMPDNADRGLPTIDGLCVMFDETTGAPCAVINARGLTLLRTAAVSALAASWLARSSARTLLMIGTGSLAPYLIEAHCAVRPIERVLVWGRNPLKAKKLAGDLTDIDCEITIASDLRAAAKQADVISCATSSAEPLLRGAFVESGTHVDLIGSYKPTMREADTDLIRRGYLVVDTKTAFCESGDLITPLREGAISNDCPTLGEVTGGTAPGRTHEDEITIFKAVGSAIADVAAAGEIVRRHNNRLSPLAQ